MLVRLAVIFLPVFFGLICTARAQEYVKGDSIVVRSNTQLRVESRTVETMPQGTELSVISVNGRWLWVTSPRTGKSGWIDSRQVAPLAPPAPPEAAAGATSAVPRSGGASSGKPTASAGSSSHALVGRIDALPDLSEIGELPDLPERKVYGDFAANIPILLSLAPLGEQILDVRHLMERAGLAAGWAAFEPMVVGATSSLDLNSPMGAFFMLSPGQSLRPEFVVFFAVEDVNQFLNVLQGLAGAKVAELGDDVWQIESPRVPRALLLRKSGRWVFVSREAKLLERLPKRPELLLGDLPETYNVALQFRPGQLKPNLREALLNGVRQGAEAAAARRQNAGKPGASGSVDFAQAICEGCNRATLGLSIDRAAGRTEIQVAYQPLRGTAAAEALAGVSAAQSPLKSLLDREGTSVLVMDALVSEDVRRSNFWKAVTQIRDFKPSARKGPEFAKFDAVMKLYLEEAARSAERGIIDAGAFIAATGDSFQYIAVTSVVDERAAEQKVQELLSRHFNADASTVGPRSDPLKLHVVHLPAPVEPEAKLLLGDRLEVAIQVHAGRMWVGIGKDVATSLPSLRESMVQQPSSIGLLEWHFDVSNFVETATVLGAFDDQPHIRDALSKLPASEGNDRVTFSYQNSTTEGAAAVLSFSDYTVRLIAALARAGKSTP